MTKKKRKNGRADAMQHLQKIGRLIIDAAANRLHTRKELAEMWGVSPRAVSYLLVHAERMYGVRFDFINDARGMGYALSDLGVFDLAELKAMARKHNW
jgi:hypothetical protein